MALGGHLQALACPSVARLAVDQLVRTLGMRPVAPMQASRLESRVSIALVFGRRERLLREMWEEIISYSRQAPNTSSPEEFEPIRAAQLHAARRLREEHPSEMKTLISRGANSDDPVTFSLRCMLAVHLGMPDAGRLLDDAEKRLHAGRQRMRHHPYYAAEGQTTEAGMIEVLELLKKENANHAGEPPAPQ